MIRWGKHGHRRRTTAMVAVALMGGLLSTPPAIAGGVLSGVVEAPTSAAADGSEPTTCANTPTGGTQIRAPYGPPELEAAMQSTWAAREQPGDGQFTYLVYVPATVSAGPVPLVVTIHGLAGNAKQHLAQTNWQTVADEHGFVVAVPNGHRRWDNEHDSVDIRFVRDVIADMRARNCIDASRIYVTGHSNGGFMTHRAACDMGDVVAAAASYAAGDVSSSPCPSDGRWPDGTTVAGWEPVPLGLWHGTNDSVVGYPAGRRGLRKWLERHDCDTTPTTTTDAFGLTEVFDHCRAGLSVAFRTLKAHGHAWPDGCGGNNSGTGGSVNCEPAPGAGPFPEAVDLARELWAFLSAHQRRTPAAAQPAPALRAPAAPSAEIATGAAGDGVEGGFDSEATFRRTYLDAGPQGLRVEFVFRVAYDGDGAGLGTSHPVCPTSNPGPGTQSMEGRTVTVSAEDRWGRVVAAEVPTEPVVVTTPDGTTEHVELVRAALPGSFHPNRTVLRAGYEGDVVKFWWACGTPPARYKETLQPGWRTGR